MGTRRQFAIMVAVMFLLIIAGCSTSSNSRTVNFVPDKITIENEKFVMSGNLSLTGRELGVTYDSVEIVLYSPQKNVIKRVPVGTLSLSNERKASTKSVQFTASKIPKYVVITSPDFWSTDVRLEVISYEYANRTGEYQEYHQTNQNDRFPDDEE